MIKLALSLIMIAILLKVVDFEELFSTLASLPLSVVALIIFGYLLGQFISCYKWLLIVRSAGIKTSYLKALRAYYIATYVNCFAFGMIGGDLARGLLVSRGHENKLAGITSVVFDRIHGLIILSIIGISSSLCFGLVGNLTTNLLLVLIALTASLLLFWVLAPLGILKVVPSKFLSSKSRFRQRIQGIANAFPRSPKVILHISALSFVFHLLQIALHLPMAYAVGTSIPITSLLVVIPYVNIFSSLPISWQGVGLREGAYIFFLTPHYITQEQAVACGVIWLSAIVISSAMGGILALLTDDLSELKTIKTEQN